MYFSVTVQRLSAEGLDAMFRFVRILKDYFSKEKNVTILKDCAGIYNFQVYYRNLLRF